MYDKLKTFAKQHREIIVYLLIGALTTVVNFAIYLPLLWWAKLPASISNAITWVIVILFAYVTNRIFVFKSKRKDKGKEFVQFTSSRVATLFLDMFVMWLMVTVWGIWDSIAVLVSQVLVTVGNYIISKLFVFRKKKEK